MKLDEIFLKKNDLFMENNPSQQKMIIRQKKRFDCKAPITKKTLYDI